MEKKEKQERTLSRTLPVTQTHAQTWYYRAQELKEGRYHAERRKKPSREGEGDVYSEQKRNGAAVWL